MGSGLKRQREDNDVNTASAQANGSAPLKRQQTRASQSQNAMNVANSQRRGSLNLPQSQSGLINNTPTPALPRPAHSLTVSPSHFNQDSKHGILQQCLPTPRPSDVLGLPTVIGRLPLATCRDALLRLPPSDIRALLTEYAIVRPRSRTVARLTNSYDTTNSPRPDQLVSFDGLLHAMTSALQPFTHGSPSPDAEAIAATILPLQHALTASNGVFVNIRILHSMSLTPASLGTKLRALQALVAFGEFLITKQLLLDSAQRDLFLEEPLGPAFFGICSSLSGPERCFVFPEVNEELEGQAMAFAAHGLFRGVIEGFQLLKAAGGEVLEVQAMPVGFGVEEEDLDEDEGQAEIGDSQELP